MTKSFVFQSIDSYMLTYQMLLHFDQDFALTISEREQSIFTEEKMDSLKLCDGNLLHRSIIAKNSRENGNVNGSLMAKNAGDGSFGRSSVSSAEDHDSDHTNSVCRYLIIW